MTTITILHRDPKLNLRDFMKSERCWPKAQRVAHYELKMRQAATLPDYQFYRAAWHENTGIEIDRCPVLFTMGGAFKERNNNDAPVPGYGKRT